MSELTVKEIKARLISLGISFEGVFEKSDLVALLESTNASDTSVKRNKTAPTVAMSVADLKDIVRSLAGRPSQCSEKIDLFNLAKDLLGSRTCSICLEKLLGSPSDMVVRVPCCSAVFHSHCLGDWALKSAQEGLYPHKCPNCPSGKLTDSFVTNHLLSPSDSSGKYLRYIAAVEGLKKLRDSAARSRMTPEEEKQLRDQGFRKCPKCGAWIEKGPAMEAFGIPIAQGCDKMTCRCGCKFCFRCGAINAECSCTGPDHGFFDHQEVLNQYPRSQLGTSNLLGSIL